MSTSLPTLKQTMCKRPSGEGKPTADLVCGRGSGPPKGPRLDAVPYLGCLGGSRLPPARPVGVLEPEEYSFGL